MEELNTNQINSYLVFKVGDEEFAANAGKVQRILEMQPVTAIPKSPRYMKGVINLMGKVLPVIDARLKMGLEEKDVDSNTCIIVLEVKKKQKTVETGIIVDSVQSVIEIQPNEIKDAPSLGFQVNEEFIHGMVEQNSKFIMLIDIDNVFSSDEVITLQEKVESVSEVEPGETR